MDKIDETDEQIFDEIDNNIYDKNGERVQTFTVAMMVKNEEKTILTTLRSISMVDILVIYDTGSTDRTIKMIEAYCRKKLITLRIKYGEFVDFGTSRNVLLRFCDEFDDIDYILLLDSNDVVKNVDALLKILPELKREMYNVKQHWIEVDGSHLHYTNVRLVKNKSGCYYKRKIHEAMYCDTYDYTYGIPNVNDETVLFQDRKFDMGKTEHRLKRDLEILVKCVYENKDNPNRDNYEYGRDLYYLAQTYLNKSSILSLSDRERLELKKMAIKYYQMRVDLKNNGYIEEAFNSALYVASINLEIGEEWDKCFLLFMRAFELSPNRIEPLMPIINHYIRLEKYSIAFMYLNYICKLEVPKVNMTMAKQNWVYYRWRCYALVCLQLGSNNLDLLKAGRASLELAIHQGKEFDICDPIDEEMLAVFDKHIPEDITCSSNEMKLESM